MWIIARAVRALNAKALIEERRVSAEQAGRHEKTAPGGSRLDMHLVLTLIVEL